MTMLRVTRYTYVCNICGEIDDDPSNSGNNPPYGWTRKNVKDESGDYIFGAHICPRCINSYIKPQNFSEDND